MIRTSTDGNDPAADGRGIVPDAGASGTIRIPIGDVLLRAAGPADYGDPDLDADLGRVRRLVGSPEIDPDIVPRATMIRARDGAPLAPLRTFAGRASHENGIMPSAKSSRSLGWQGENQANMIVRAQTMHEVAKVATESVAFGWTDAGRACRYTADVELVREDGAFSLVEMKRDERDLDDPDYCRSLAIVAEICRCCAIPFSILFARDVFASRVHRVQAHEFAARAFHPFDDGHRLAVRRLAEAGDGTTTLGALREALCPGDRLRGDAVVQAMTVARIVEIDLVRRVRSDTLVRLHPRNLSG